MLSQGMSLWRFGTKTTLPSQTSTTATAMVSTPAALVIACSTLATDVFCALHNSAGLWLATAHTLGSFFNSAPLPLTTTALSTFLSSTPLALSFAPASSPAPDAMACPCKELRSTAGALAIFGAAGGCRAAAVGGAGALAIFGFARLSFALAIDQQIFDHPRCISMAQLVNAVALLLSENA